MKKTLIFSFIAICLMFTFMDTAFSQETLTHGCYNWRRGNLRIVANPNQCVPSYESYIPWHKAIPPGGFTLHLYVNGASGQDLPGRGLTPTDPFQTITYALQQLIKFRPTQEIETFMYLAPAIYNENLIITGDNIQVIKDESYAGDVIIDGGGKDVITIVSARGVSIKGVTVQSGYYGINGIRGAVFKVEDTIIQDNGNDGIRTDENSASRLVDLTVQRNGDEGIEVIRNSNAAFFGSILSKQNKSAGLVIAANSSVWCEEQSTLIISENSEQSSLEGIRIGNSSNFIAFDWTSITVQSNYRGGVGMVRNSSMSVHGNSTFLVKENQYGLALNTSTLFASNIEVTDNSGRGIAVDDGSSVNFSNSIIIDNTGFDVYMNFCSRATLYGNIGSIYCDECSRIRGDATCQ